MKSLKVFALAAAFACFFIPFGYESADKTDSFRTFVQEASKIAQNSNSQEENHRRMLQGMDQMELLSEEAYPQHGANTTGGNEIGKITSNNIEDQVNPYATFTEQKRIFDNRGESWKGKWRETVDKSNSYLANFDNKDGPVYCNFEFDPRIKKTLMHMVIKDYEYLDSGKLFLSVNLKMSKYNASESSFTTKANHGDEYYAEANLAETMFNTMSLMYFDIDFKLIFRDRATNAPLDLNSYNPDNVLIKFKLTSKDLNINIEGELYRMTPPASSLWLSLGVLISAAILLILSTSLASFQTSFIINIGCEVIGLMSIFYYHLFCAFLQLGKTYHLYNTTLYILSLLIFIQCMLMMIFAMNYLTIVNVQGHLQPYYCGLMVLYLALLIITGVYTPRLIFTRQYCWYLVFFVGLLPAFQFIATLKKAMSSNVFNVKYQIIGWWTVIIYATFIKGIHNPLVELKPQYLIPVVGFGSAIFFGLIMLLQHKCGVYFMLPNFCIPNYTDLKVPMSRVPEEKQNEECPICYFPIKVDPERAQVELQEINHEEVNAADHQPMLPQATVAMKTPCNHYFHPTCLRAWIRTRHSCPICNQKVVIFE